MTRDDFTDRLNDYVDGALEPGEKTLVERHLSSCRACRELEADLRTIRRQAKALGNPDPPERVWTSVAAAIERRHAPSKATEVRTYLALAALILLAVAIFLARRPSPAVDDQEALVTMVTEELRTAEAHYDNAIGGLEQIVVQNDGVLSEELVLVLNENLDLIEKAIEESRQAIRSEPDSKVAQESLLEALRRKVSLLQNTIRVINEVRKGQGENAFDLIEEMKGTEAPSNPI
ncbi:MAG TPA: zf-HC2 domain-containing protein [Vicinamibacteria bacterium]|nr:zf-HC2 domain-containing protein [Vicinamibacteria bacterium]